MDIDRSEIELEYKGKLYGIYAELCKVFETDKDAMKKIDKIFEKVEE